MAYYDSDYKDTELSYRAMVVQLLPFGLKHEPFGQNRSNCFYNKVKYSQQKSFHADGTITYYGEAMAIVRADGTCPVQITVADETSRYTVDIPCRE